VTVRKTFIALALLSLAALTLVACKHETPHQKSALERVRAAGALRWGGDLQGGEPYVYQDPDHPGRVIGFEVDLANAIARELGVRAEFVQNDWSNLIPALERGTFDVAMNGVEITPARKERVAFSRPYYAFAERLMARKGPRNFTTDLASLKGHRVGTLANSLAFDILRDHCEVVLYEGTEEPYIDLSRGRTDAVLLDDIIVTRYGEPHHDLEVVGDMTEGYYAIAVAKTDPELLHAIDDALTKITASGEWEKILTRADLWNGRQVSLAKRAIGDPLPTVENTSAAAHAHLSREHVFLFLKGAAMTIFVSTLAMMLAVALGIGLAIARAFGPAPLRFLAGAYVEIYRGTPVLLQLYVLYYGLASIIRIDALPAAVIGLGMNYAAYEAEVYRAGMQAVPKGQMEAAMALGMTMPLALRRVLLPQAFRAALPNVTNDFIALLKDSSLVSVITVVELTKQMAITAVDTRDWVFPGLLCASLYFAMSYPLSLLARHMEARMARS
jgi:polar amino acid transport system substrate-binding protein